MTRTYWREIYDFGDDDYGNIIVTSSSVKIYSFSIYPGDNSIMTISRDGITKTVKIEDCSENVYKLERGRIKAHNGAKGLFEFLDDCLFEDFATCLAYQILDHAIDKMEEA